MADNDLVKNLKSEDTKNNKGILDSLDKFISKTQPIGSIDKAIGNNLWGLNHRKIRGALPPNKDEHGYLFFTRPQLNLSSGNINNYRKFMSLLNKYDDRIQRYIRCLLDPRLHFSKNITTPLLDYQSAFIPILTNTMSTNSGWPDIVNTSFISKAGMRREQFSMVDGMVDMYEAFDLDVTFRNMREEPTTIIIDTWLHYMSCVFEGVLMPYMDFIVENEIDYNTRIYRMVLSEDKKYVKKISCTGASYPVNLPTGRFFDYSDERPYNDQTKDISVRWKCNGVVYNDDIVIHWFNQAVGIFNPEMRRLNNTAMDIIKRGKFNPKNPMAGILTGSLEKIPDNLLDKFNFRGYPRINPMTMEMEWWASKSDIEYMFNEFPMGVFEENSKRAQSLLGTDLI